MFSQIDIARHYNAIAASETAAECVKIFVEALAPFGLDKLAAGEVDVADRDLAVVYAVHWPERWRQFYFSSGLHERNPIIQSLPLYGCSPFTWRDLRKDRRIAQVDTSRWNYR